MICPRCGANNDNGEQFCYNCGFRLDSAVQGQSQGASAPPVPQVPPYRPAYEDTPPVYDAPPVYQPLSPGHVYAPVSVTSTAAIVSLVAGIVSWIAFPFVSAIVAIIAGHMARADIRRAGGRVDGSGMALAGLILGYLNVIIVSGVICLGILAFITLGIRN